MSEVQKKQTVHNESSLTPLLRQEYLNFYYLFIMIKILNNDKTSNTSLEHLKQL